MGGEMKTIKVYQTALEPYEWIYEEGKKVSEDLQCYLNLVDVMLSTIDTDCHNEFCCIYRKGRKDTVLNNKRTWTNRKEANEKV